MQYLIMFEFNTIDISTSSGAITSLSRLNELKAKIDDTQKEIIGLESDFIALLFIPDILAIINNENNDDKTARDLKAEYQKKFQNISIDKTQILNQLANYEGLKKVLQINEYYIKSSITEENKRHGQENNV